MWTCRDALDDGFDFIEAYPQKEYINEAKHLMGPAELFKKSGFTIHGETEDRLIMRKSLDVDVSK